MTAKRTPKTAIPRSMVDEAKVDQPEIEKPRSVAAPEGGFDLGDFDLAAQSQSGTEIQITTPDGRPIEGVFMHILGEHSETVRDFLLKEKFALGVAERKAHLNKKEFDYDRYNDALVIKSAMIRTIAWRGIKQPFTQENLETLLKSNRNIAHQILIASATEGNFTKALPIH